jgi:hypothetical protein
MSGDLDGARRLFEQALRLDPACERARELLGTKPADEALPEELQHVPSSATNLFAVPLPRLFPEPTVERPEAPTDPFIPLAMVPPLPPLSERPPAAPPPVASRAWTPLPVQPPLVPAPQAAPAEAPAITLPPTPVPLPGRPRGSAGKTPPPQPSAPVAARETPAPAPPAARGTPLPSVAPSAPRQPPKKSKSSRTPVPPPPPPSVGTVAPPPEPGPSADSPGTVGSDDWWTDGVSTPAPPKDAWEVGRPRPTTLPPSEATEGDALNLVAPLPASAGGTPLPAKMPSDPRLEARKLLQRARELQGLDDHSGARELLQQAQALDSEAPEVVRALAESEQTLQALYESKLGKLTTVPRVRLREDEVIWLNLDHRAGFILAQIDGTLTFDDLFSVSGMSRLDTARILVQLLEQRVIIR